MGHLEPLGMSPLAMMSMAEQYPWMKEKKSARKSQIQGIGKPNNLKLFLFSSPLPCIYPKYFIHRKRHNGHPIKGSFHVKPIWKVMQNHLLESLIFLFPLP